MVTKRIVVGITGASGADIAYDLLTELREHHPEWEVHLIMTKSARLTIELESRHRVDDFISLAEKCYNDESIYEGPASGTFRTEGMIIVPCSMKTAAGIVSGFSESLLLRAADVTIKEHRQLVLCTRESPLSQIHLRNLYELSKIQNVWIVPPMMVHYIKPECVGEMEHHITAKLLSPFGIETSDYKRWKDETP